MLCYLTLEGNKSDVLVWRNKQLQKYQFHQDRLRLAWDGEDSDRPRTTFSRFANRDRLFTVKFVIDEGTDKTALCYQITILDIFSNY